MSDSKLKAAIGDIVTIAQKRKEGSNKKSADSEARGLAEKFHGQILVLNRFEINATLQKHFEVSLTDTELNEIFDGAIHDELIRRQNAIKWASPKDKENTLWFLKNQIELKNGDNAYMISNFEAAKASKYKAKNKGKDVASILTDYINEKKKKNLSAEAVSRSIQLGHGDRGAASSEFGLARAVSIVAEKHNLTKAQTQQLYTVIFSQREKHGLETKVDHSQMFTSGGVFSKYFRFIVSYQDKDLNLEDAKKEAAAFSGTLAQWDIIGTETSTLVPDAIGRVLTDAATPKSKRAKGTGIAKIQEKSKAKNRRRISSVVAKPFQVVRGLNPSEIKVPKKVSNAGKSGASLVSLMALINQKLPDTVRKNMKPPGLTNVTGQFANSVRVTDITPTRKGYPSIGYTYRKEPYQVFELKNGKAPWATKERDPRTLIDASIREIAANMAIGRFYTRRQ